MLTGELRSQVDSIWNTFWPGGMTATPDQIEFIDLIVSELTQTGVMDARRLYESPFLDISPQGPEGLFPLAKVPRQPQSGSRL